MDILDNGVELKAINKPKIKHIRAVQNRVHTSPKETKDVSENVKD